jgi:hypothetical protein
MHIGTSFWVRLFQVIWIRIHNISFNQHKEAFLKLHFNYHFYKIVSLVHHSDLTSALDSDLAKVSDPDPAKVLNPDLA